MALLEGQVQVGSLVLGPGTPYTILNTFNPKIRNVRADQGDSRAWGDGSWSGAEWAEERTIPIPVLVEGANRDLGSWTQADQALAAAFAPSHTDVEIRWMHGGVEYMMRGRPRMVDPNVETVGLGYAFTQCAFVALDPTTYSGTEHHIELGLPTSTGGLTVPLTVPFTVDATVIAGRESVFNAGSKPVGLKIRIHGPVQEPRVSLLTPAGTAVLRFWLTLTDSQWLDIDTSTRTVYLNGTASRRGLTTASGIGWPSLLPGTGEIAFDSSVYSPTASLEVWWRDAWH